MDRRPSARIRGAAHVTSARIRELLIGTDDEPHHLDEALDWLQVVHGLWTQKTVMELHERANGQVVVVDVQGPIDRSSDAQPGILLERLRVLVDQGYNCILLNVAQVTYVDSVLLGAVVQAYTSVVRRGATLKLLNVTKRFRDLLAVTRLDTVLETAESEDVDQV